jgi:hypothetical protein
MEPAITNCGLVGSSPLAAARRLVAAGAITTIALASRHRRSGAAPYVAGE